VNYDGTAIDSPMLTRSTALLVSACAVAAVMQPLSAQDGVGPVWPKLNAAQRTEATKFGDDFKQFIGSARSETSFVRETAKLLEASGFHPWPAAPKKSDVAPGSRWYAVNRGRTIAAFVIGTDPVVSGTRIVNSHNDSVRLELKPKPFRDSFEISMLDTTPHGGMKNYQWVNRPLALIGRVTRSDGTAVDVSIGLDPGDAALMITDLAPHVDNDFRERRNRDVIQGEELDPILALTRDAAMRALKERYNLTADDFLSADLHLVPAQAPTDIGIDHQLVGAFGEDGRVNGFAAFRAIVEVRNPQRTAIAYGVNNEEVGSWTTGVQSEWFSTLVGEMIAAQEPSYSELMVRHAFRASQALVSDCTTALDPGFPQPSLPNSTARLGWGFVIKEYGSGRQADAEYAAQVRRMLTDAGVPWQVHANKVGYGGATIAQWFANADIDAIDVGIGILSMHSPMEVAAKVDIWSLYRGFKAFWAAAPRPGAPTADR